MTQGMQTALCYIRKVNNSNSYNAFLSDHGIPQGWKQFPDIYLLFANTQHTWGALQVGIFYCVYGFVFFNGQVAIKSLPVFDMWHSVIAHLLHVKQEAPNWIWSQLKAPSSTASMNMSVKFIYWEGTGDVCFPQALAPAEPITWGVLRAQLGKPGWSHTWMNYL